MLGPMVDSVAPSGLVIGVDLGRRVGLGEINERSDAVMVENARCSGGPRVGPSDETGEVVLMGVGGDDVFELAIAHVIAGPAGIFEVILDRRIAVVAVPRVDQDVVVARFDVGAIPAVVVPLLDEIEGDWGVFRAEGGVTRARRRIRARRGISARGGDDAGRGFIRRRTIAARRGTRA